MFTVLAPMEDVTNSAFRRIVASVARPDIFVTEFTNIEAILHGVVDRLFFTPQERPIIAQIWGTDPKKFYRAAGIVKEMNFDGIDINLGCPVKKVLKNGACGAMIGKNSIVSEIISAVQEGGKLPVSVKTRLGIKKIDTENWIGFLLTQNLSAITIHGRTVSEMSKVPAHWDEIGKAVKLRDQICRGGPSCPPTQIIGNGDVVDYADAKQKANEFGVDGVMIGRGVFANIACFDKTGRILTKEEKLTLMHEHDKLESDKNRFKKYIKIYINGFEGAAAMRDQIFATIEQ